MAKERTLESQSIYRGRVVNLRLDTVELADGRRAQREVVEHEEVVAIVPLDSQGNVLLVRQYRHAVEQTMLEIPAGGVEPGEDPLECTQRELQEETGYKAQNIQRIGGFHISPGFCTEYIHLFLATDLQPSPLKGDVDEDIELVPVTLGEIPDLIQSGDIKDAKSIAGLLTFLAFHQEKTSLR